MDDNHDYECFVPSCDKTYEKESHRNQHYSRSSDEDHEQHRSGQYRPSLEDSFNEKDTPDQGNSEDKKGEETLDNPESVTSSGLGDGQDKPLQQNTDAKVVEIPEEDNSNDSDKWKKPAEITPAEVENAYEEEVNGSVIIDRLRKNPAVSEVNLETKQTR